MSHPGYPIGTLVKYRASVLDSWSGVTLKVISYKEFKSFQLRGTLEIEDEEHIVFMQLVEILGEVPDRAWPLNSVCWSSNPDHELDIIAPPEEPFVPRPRKSIILEELA